MKRCTWCHVSVDVWIPRTRVFVIVTRSNMLRFSDWGIICLHKILLTKAGMGKKKKKGWHMYHTFFYVENNS